MKLSTLLLSLIPGVGQIQAGRARWGILLFLVFALSLNGYLIAPFLNAGRTLRILLLIAAGIAWSASFVDGLRGEPSPEKSASLPEPEREQVYEDH